MPELPETETISRDVFTLAGGREVTRAGVFRRDVTNVEPGEFPERLVGRRLIRTSRRGKVIVLDFGEVVGLVHLVISGRVVRLPEWVEPDHTNTAVLEFGGDGEDGSGVVLSFTKLWLGYFQLYEPAEVDKHPLISRLGPDPFSEGFTLRYLARILSRNANVKGLLLDQSMVAGLGNIYVDEVLFASGVNPRRKAATLTAEEALSLHDAIQRILGRAIELRGTTFDSYHDAFGENGGYQDELRVFAREGEPCYTCGTEVEKTRVAGRGTHYCPVCQPG